MNNTGLNCMGPFICKFFFFSKSYSSVWSTVVESMDLDLCIYEAQTLELHADFQLCGGSAFPALGICTASWVIQVPVCKRILPLSSYSLYHYCHLLQLYINIWIIYTYCCCSVTKLCPTLRPHELQHARVLCPSLSEFPQISVHWVGDAIQPSYPLPPSSPAFSLLQHQGLFQWVGLFASNGQSIGTSASRTALPMNIQAWFSLGLTGLIVQGTLKNLL